MKNIYIEKIHTNVNAKFNTKINVNFNINQSVIVTVTTTITPFLTLNQDRLGPGYVASVFLSSLRETGTLIPI